VRLSNKILGLDLAAFREKVENHWCSDDSTQPCRSSTPTVNGHDLTLPTQTQTSEQEYSDLTASNKWPSIPHSQKTPQSFSQGTRLYAFLRSTKHVKTFLTYSQDFSKSCWRVKCGL